PHAFSSRSLLGRHLPVLPEQRWIAHQALLPCRHVEAPQLRHRVVTGRRSEEENARTVGGDPEGPGEAEREAPRPSLLPWEGEPFTHAHPRELTGSAPTPCAPATTPARPRAGSKSGRSTRDAGRAPPRPRTRSRCGSSSTSRRSRARGRTPRAG